MTGSHRPLLPTLLPFRRLRLCFWKRCQYFVQAPHTTSQNPELGQTCKLGSVNTRRVLSSRPSPCESFHPCVSFSRYTHPDTIWTLVMFNAEAEPSIHHKAYAFFRHEGTSFWMSGAGPSIPQVSEGKGIITFNKKLCEFGTVKRPCVTCDSRGFKQSRAHGEVCVILSRAARVLLMAACTALPFPGWGPYLEASS